MNAQQRVRSEKCRSCDGATRSIRRHPYFLESPMSSRSLLDKVHRAEVCNGRRGLCGWDQDRAIATMRERTSLTVRLTSIPQAAMHKHKLPHRQGKHSTWLTWEAFPFSMDEQVTWTTPESWGFSQQWRPPRVASQCTTPLRTYQWASCNHSW